MRWQQRLFWTPMLKLIHEFLKLVNLDWIQDESLQRLSQLAEFDALCQVLHAHLDFANLPQLLIARRLAFCLFLDLLETLPPKPVTQVDSIEIASGDLRRSAYVGEEVLRAGDR